MSLTTEAIRRTLTAAAAAAIFATGAAVAAEPEVKTIRFLGNPSAGSAVVWIAKEKGYFADEGIDLTIERDFAAGLVTDSLLSGAVDMVYGGVMTMMMPYAKGAPLALIASTDYDTAWEVLVPETSQASSLEDLRGKTIAVISPRTMCVLALKRAAEQNGWPEDTFKFTVAAPTDQVAAFGAGRLDATCIHDPVRTQIKAQFGGKPVWNMLEPASNTIAGSIGGGLVVQQSFVDANPNTVAAIQRAVGRAGEEATRNPDAVYEALAAATEQSVDKLKTIALPKYAVPPSLSPQIRELAEAIHKYGLSPTPIDTAAFDRTAPAATN